VARVGGDEFVIILPFAKDATALEIIGQRIIDQLSCPIAFQGEVCNISASIGTAIYQPGSRQTVAEIMDDADVALYASKNRGRAMQTLYEPSLRNKDKALAAADRGESTVRS